MASAQLEHQVPEKGFHVKTSSLWQLWPAHGHKSPASRFASPFATAWHVNGLAVSSGSKPGFAASMSRSQVCRLSTSGLVTKALVPSFTFAQPAVQPSPTSPRGWKSTWQSLLVRSRIRAFRLRVLNAQLVHPSARRGAHFMSVQAPSPSAKGRSCGKPPLMSNVRPT